MTILLILLILLLILVVLRLFIVKEGFATLDSTLIQNYNNYLQFYNPFCTNWTNAITSSIVADIPQEPLSSPSQVSMNTSTVPQPSTNQLNTYISQLSQQLGQVLPPICKPLPESVDSTNIPELLQIPSDSASFVNALNWMNNKLQSSHSNLGVALQGGKPQEGFDDMCQDISQCLANNPQILAQIGQQAQQEQEQQISQNIQSFFSNQEISQSAGLNTDLVKKSQDIQNQAQSGALYSQVNIPGSNSTPIQQPAGGNTLTQMEQNDPQQYNNLKQNSGQWFAIKQLMEQINNTF